MDNPLAKRVKRALILPLFFLIIPLIGEFNVDGWNWGVGGFIFAYVIWSVTALSYVFLSNRFGYNLVVGIILYGFLTLVWVILATG